MHTVVYLKHALDLYFYHSRVLKKRMSDNRKKTNEGGVNTACLENHYAIAKFYFSSECIYGDLDRKTLADADIPQVTEHLNF